MRRFALLVLDFDGTLVDSEAILVGLVNDTLATAGLPHADPRAIAATIGLPLGEVLQRAAPSAPAAAVAALCVAYRRCADADAFVRQFRLHAGVHATLAVLRQAGLRLIVGTSKGRATTLDILAHCGIAPLIHDVIGGDCVSQGKPHPEMVHRACRESGIATPRTLVIGDTSFDMQMGRGAGAATCAVTYGMHAAPALRALRPDFVIDRFDALTGILLATR